jgi:hypothetical protein
MSQTEPAPLLLVAWALVDADHRMLLTRHPEAKPMTGSVGVPGGKLLAANARTVAFPD